MEEEKPTMHHGAKPQIFKNAHRLRSEMTPAENILWKQLRKKQLAGFKFRRQHSVLYYILDFYCHQARLGIEVDGGYHASPMQKEADQIRTNTLYEVGIMLIRFTNREVEHQLEWVLEKIRSTCVERV